MPMVGENSCHGNSPQIPQEHFPSARENTSAAREASGMVALSAQAERGTELSLLRIKQNLKPPLQDKKQ